MIKIDTHNIQAHDDFELNIPRKNLLTYHMAYNDTKKPEGIIFILPGFDKDSVVQYQKNLINYISEKYNLLAVFVEYHGLFARPSTDKETATCKFGVNDTEILIKYIEMLNIQLDEDNLDYENIVRIVDQHIQKLKSLNQIEPDLKLDMWATLYPYKDEYQNFGILQAIDILSVLYHLKSIGYDNIIKEKHIIALGSSHGGYLANLLMKFAPNTFDIIIDNSCYIKPPLNYIIGFETNPYNPELTIFYPNIKMHLFTLNYWSTQKNSINEFNKGSYEIRDLSNANQLKQLISYNSKTQVISYHSEFDQLASFNDKKNYIEYLKTKNSQCIFNRINSESQIDGKLIKHLNHAMGMSMKALIDKELGDLLNTVYITSATDLCLKSTIEYTLPNDKKFVIQFHTSKIVAKLQ